MPPVRPPKTPASRTVARALDTLLEGYYPPPPEIKPGTGFTRRHDDTDGETGFAHEITVGLSADADAWVVLPDRALRFRGPFGGGMSPRVQRALIVLAEAIRRDNAERPQDPPRGAR